MRRRRSAPPRTATWCSGPPIENSLAGLQPAATNKPAETPHSNVTAKNDRLRRELTKIRFGTTADLDHLNAADRRERAARGTKAVA